ncbi:MAG: chorismate synthase [Planctomycetota bacterium]|jgi:chorismate synthase
MLRYLTAGESHGKCLVAVITGIPFGTPVDADHINRELSRRQGGYGRGKRQQMEKDEVQILTGIRGGKTIGGPLTLQVPNRVRNIESQDKLVRPRPGHADLAGVMKYGGTDARSIAERSSARETAARVAAGAFASGFLRAFDVRVLGYLLEMGGVGSDRRLDDPEEIRRIRDASEFHSLDPALDAKLRKRVDEVRGEGDSLGGVFEVAAFGVPPGLGSHTQWDLKLDGRLARALMTVQTVKCVEIGAGAKVAGLTGSQNHDEIVKHLGRTGNNAGGIEGGMSNGQPVIVRASCKPIPTLKKPLRTVNLETGEEQKAKYERSDTCVIPAASVIGEAVAAFEILGAFLGKFGADTFEETRERHDAYAARLRERFGA